jgi:hypothetical protein
VSRPLLSRALPLAGALLAVPLVLGTLPSAAAAPAAAKVSPGQAKKATATSPSAAAPRVVVADVDSGVNPYHEAFYAHGPSEVTPDVLAEFGIGADGVVELTRTGDFAADFAADRPSGTPSSPASPTGSRAATCWASRSTSRLTTAP